MRKLFNEYGGWIVIVFVIVVLLLMVGGIKSPDDNGKIKGTGLIATVGNMVSNTIEKNNNHLRYLNGECGPNGESLVSTTESQVGKYADVDGDGTVDGIIFADLLFGGSGIFNDYDTSLNWANKQGIYDIPKIAESKKYYISQKEYYNKLSGTKEVITPLDNGANRFYVMSLNSKANNTTWYKNMNYIPENEFITSILLVLENKIQ